MKRAVFVTSHYLDSHRKAGFHWLAGAFHQAGWNVIFFTESISWLSILRGDARCQYPIVSEAKRLLQRRERLASYVWLTPFHPIQMRSRFLNRLTAPLFRQYSKFSISAVESEIQQANLFIFDSDHGLFLFDRFKGLNPEARFVYRVSDHIPMMGHHPLLVTQEERVLDRFDLVSVPSEFFVTRFAGRSNVSLHHHGLDKALFDLPCDNPYASPRPNVIYAGKHHFDSDFISRAARLFPDWSFHVFGGVGPLPKSKNVFAHGERPFAELVPYLKHADVGLQALAYTPGAEAFSDSLKMQQYMYCRLPIVAPAFLYCHRPNVIQYQPGDDASIRSALLAANSMDRSQIANHGLESWGEIAERLAPPIA